ncbi:MAG: DUF3563 family protein [Rhodoferax sp.]|nr:DUF3563 family protein [Rhodoferax sp.]
MSRLIEIIKSFLPAFRSQHDIEEAFLSEASDVSDLERRMRLIDADTRESARGLLYGKLMP